MKRILLINLKRYGDLLFSSHVAASLKAQNPFASIEIVCYKEFERAIKNITVFEKVHTIDRKKLAFLYQTKSFSKAQALENFYTDIYDCYNEEWDLIVNLSNEKVGCFLSSFLYAKEKKGISFNENALIDHSSLEAFYLNEVVSTVNETPHLLDCYLNLLEIPYYHSNNLVKMRGEDQKLVYKNFNDIRNAVGKSHCKILGIQFTSSNETKNLSEKTVIKLLKKLNQGTDYFPVLLISKSESERNAANKINEALNNKIVTIESDFQALASVLQQLDAIITVDSAAKHLADLLDTPTLEISAGAAPMYQYSTVREGNLLLSPVISCRPCSLSGGCTNKSYLECHQLFSAEDIFNSVEILFGEDVRKLEFSPTLTLFRVEANELGHNLRPIAGSIESQKYLNYCFSKLFLYSVTNGEKLVRTDHLSFVPKEDFNFWRDRQKTDLALFTKDLLTSIRIVKELQAKGQSELGKLIGSLEKLFSYKDKSHAVSQVAFILRGKVENIHVEKHDQSFDKIELGLYESKNLVKIALKNIEMLSVKSESITNKREASNSLSAI